MDSKQFPYTPGLRLAETPTTQALIDQAPGVDGIRQTLAIMKQLKESYRTNPVIRGLAMSLISHLPQKDYQGEIKALTDYVKNRVRYTRDVAGVETLQTPIKTLEFGQGDCDDKSTLLAAMLESIGHRCKFQAVGMRKGNFCHVYVLVNYKNKWLSLETTEPVGVGWEPPGIVEKMSDSPELDGLGSSLKKSFKKGFSITKSVYSGGAGKPSEVLNIKKRVGNVAGSVIAIPGVEKLLKVKYLAEIMSAIGWLYPPLGAAMTYARYAIDIAKAAGVLDSAIKLADSKGRAVLPDGTPLADARAELARMQADANAASLAANKIINIDRAGNLVIYSGLTAMGAGAYYYIKRR